jgi:hypothetical protein
MILSITVGIWKRILLYEIIDHMVEEVEPIAAQKLSNSLKSKTS